MSKTLRVLAISVAVALTLGACGGDSEEPEGNDEVAEQPSETPSESASEGASDEEFCAALLEAEAAVNATQEGGDPAAVEPLLQEVEAMAPDYLSSQLEVVISAVREALAKKTDEPFRTEEFRGNEEALDEWVLDRCGYGSVEVAASEYKFDGVPQTLDAGVTNFTFSNEGEEVHEMIMFRFKDETTTAEDILKLPQAEAEKKVEFVSAAFGPPGTRDIEARSLDPGRYALLCFIPVGAASEEDLETTKGPPHATRGMTAEFTVE